MAAYITHEDVEKLIAGRDYSFDNATKPTATQVDEYCEQKTVEIDGVLKQAGYVTPVVDADALKLIELYVAYGVASLVEPSYMPDLIESSERDLATYYGKLYKDALNRISSHQLDAPKTSDASGGIGSFWTSSDCDDDDKEPMFKKEDRY